MQFRFRQTDGTGVWTVRVDGDELTEGSGPLPRLRSTAAGCGGRLPWMGVDWLEVDLLDVAVAVQVLRRMLDGPAVRAEEVEPVGSYWGLYRSFAVAVPLHLVGPVMTVHAGPVVQIASQWPG